MLCVLAGFAVVLFTAMIVLNDYVDTKVPVALRPGTMVIQSEDQDSVMVIGTWTREGHTIGSDMGNPLQTSRIICYRQKGACLEATASVSGNLLIADLNEYDIDRWDDTTVVFESDYPCATTLYTIDRKTESVNGIEHFTNMNTDYCKRFTDDTDDNVKYHLVDGFKVYWEQRQTARPMLLRLIQSFFGH